MGIGDVDLTAKTMLKIEAARLLWGRGWTVEEISKVLDKPLNWAEDWARTEDGPDLKQIHHHVGHNLETYHRPDRGWYVRYNDLETKVSGWCGPKKSEEAALAFGRENLVGKMV